MNYLNIITIFTFLGSFLSCAQTENTGKSFTTSLNTGPDMSTNKLEKETFGTGCFWCTEAIFDQLNGVEKAVSGYSGGQTENPTYKDVTGGETGHAECIEITYDPEKLDKR